MPGTPELVDSYRELVDAQPEYERAENFYNGTVDEVFTSERVQWLMAKSNTADIDDFNYAKIPVDVITGKLQISAVTAVPAEDNDTEPATGGQQNIEHAQDLIRRVRERNQLTAEEPIAHQKTNEYGDAYIFVWPVTDGNDNGRVIDVDVFVHDATTVRAFYDPERPLEMTHVLQAWEVETPPENDPGGKPETRQRATLYYPDRIERWITLPGKTGKAIEDWEPYQQDQPEHDPDQDPTTDEMAGQIQPGHQINNPHGQIPFFHLRNGRPYGSPRHKSAYGPQLLISKLISAHAVTIDFQSFPQRYALMDPKQDQPLANFIDPKYPEDEDDDPEGDDNTTQLRSDPAAVWRLRGMNQVGQFDPANPDNFMKPFDRYVKAMSELTGIPLYKFGTSFAQPPTGAALRQIEAPTDEEAENLQHQFGSVWSDVYEFALQLYGVTGVRVEVKWRPVARVTDQEGWQTLGLKIASGVTVRQALLEAGYTTEQVDDMLPDDATQDLIRQVQILNQIGTAVQSLGAGVSLGVLSQDQAAAAIQRVLALGEKDGGAPEQRLALPPNGYGSVGGKPDLLEPKPPGAPAPPSPDGQPQPAPAGGL